MRLLLTAPVAVALIVMGVIALVAPARILATFGVSVTNADGRNEVRAVYGGYGVMSGALIFWAPRVPEWRDGIFVAMGVSMASMALGRAIGALCERPRARSPIWLFFVLELGLAGLLFAATRVAAGAQGL